MSCLNMMSGSLSMVTSLCTTTTASPLRSRRPLRRDRSPWSWLILPFLPLSAWARPSRPSRFSRRTKFSFAQVGRRIFKYCVSKSHIFYAEEYPNHTWIDFSLAPPLPLCLSLPLSLSPSHTHTHTHTQEPSWGLSFKNTISSNARFIHSTQSSSRMSFAASRTTEEDPLALLSSYSYA